MTWRISVNLMNNGPMLTINSIDIGFGFAIPLIPRENESSIYFGLCNDETCLRLLSLLSPFQIGFITSDDWGNYARDVPSEMHLTGKIFTQRIERNNLT